MFHSTQDLSRSQKRTQQDLDAAILNLNARITKLSEATLPKQPYLLSVPSDVPYRHSSRFVQTWYVGTPFTCREEQLQYLSLLPHNGEYEDLLKVEGGWADEDGSFADDSIHTQGTESIPGTPSDKVSRKKISLKDYKKEKSLTDIDNTTLKPATVKLEKSPSIKTGKEETMSQRSPDRVERKHERGRSPVRAEGRKDPITSYDGTSSPKHEHYSPRPLKKRKLSDSPPTKSERENTQGPKRMPKLLSPTLPASPHRNHELPDLLSPLLPPTLMKALATPPSTSSSESNNLHRRSDSVRSILGTINEDVPRSTEKSALIPGSITNNRVRSDSQHSARSATSPSGKALPRPGLIAGNVTPATSRSPGPRQRHIIVLKYGKKNRKRVEALLKFKPRPKLPVKTVTTTDTTKHVLPTPLSSKEGTKQNDTRDRSPDRPTSKAKSLSAVEAIKRPSTPQLNGTKDGRHAGSPPSKTVTGTPKKEFKSTAMRRVESLEGVDPSTPGSKPRASTPASIDRSRIIKPSPLPTSAPGGDHSEDRQGWAELDKEREYFSLSRKLKHEGSALADKATNMSEMQKPILLMIEALLGFMLNTAIQGYVRPRVDPGWSTILGYYNFIFNKSRHFPHLHGLVIQLGAVCRQAIQKANMERLARDPLPDEHTGAAPTPGSDGNTKGGEDVEGYKKRYLQFRDELIQNTEELHSAWLKGSRLLSIELLQREYPETWRGRIKDFDQRGLEKLSPSRGDHKNGLARGYYLPVDPATNPFEAVEYALKVMGEWADREDVDWRARLRL